VSADRHDGLIVIGTGAGGATAASVHNKYRAPEFWYDGRPFLLLDEPTAHLDAATADRIRADVARAAAGRTTTITSHRPEEFARLPELRPAADQSGRGAP
jgi:ATP-binding cassette subfamily C protein CydCD